MRNVYGYLVSECGKKGILGRAWHRSEDNITSTSGKN
jgi:hypothetical protein